MRPCQVERVKSDLKVSIVVFSSLVSLSLYGSGCPHTCVFFREDGMQKNVQRNY